MPRFEDSQQGGEPGPGRYSWVRQIIGIIFVVGVFAIIFAIRGRSPSMSASAEEGAVVLSYENEDEGENFTLRVEYDQIKDLELRDEFEPGTCLSGGEVGNYQYGEYENEELGEYTLCISSRSNNYLITTLLDDSRCVFNWSSTRDTEALYDAILEMLD